MKKIFRFKLEMFNVIMSVIGLVLSYSLYITCDSDWRIKALMYFCGGMLLMSMYAYKPIQEFRKEVYRRW